MPRFNAPRKQGSPMRQCPLCTYPLSSMLNEEHTKKYSWCSNKRCGYERWTTLRKKK